MKLRRTKKSCHFLGHPLYVNAAWSDGGIRFVYCGVMWLNTVYCWMKDLKKTVSEQRAEMMEVLNDVEKLVDREKHTTDPAIKQLVKKLHRSASDAQIRYNGVKLFCVFANYVASNNVKLDEYVLYVSVEVIYA